MASWMDRYNLLLDYYKEYGNIDIPIPKKYKKVCLGQWLYLEKKKYLNGELEEDKIELLEKLGVNWSFNDNLWDSRFILLKEYKEKFGTANINYDIIYKEVKLGVWAHTQRHRRNIGVLKEDRIKKLDSLGFSWDMVDSTWRCNLEMYKDLKKTDKKIDTSCYSPMANWIYTQRVLYNEGLLSSERIEMLEDADFIWNPRNMKFDRCARILKKSAKEYGIIDIPAKYVCDGFNIGDWLNSRRRAYYGKNGRTITDYEIVELNKLGIDWSPIVTKILNREITSDSKDTFNKALLERLDYILRDLKLENKNEMNNTLEQQEINKVITKRLFR